MQQTGTIVVTNVAYDYVLRGKVISAVATFSKSTAVTTNVTKTAKQTVSVEVLK